MNAMRTDFVSDDDYDVFGDGVVIIKRAYGYTPGSTVLAVNLRDTGWIAGSRQRVICIIIPRSERWTGSASGRPVRRTSVTR